MKKTSFSFLAILMAVANIGYLNGQSLRQPVASEPYQWKSVQIVGGGFVDGIIFHPNEKNVRYCRTDMGGAYRWDNAVQRWVSMLDGISYADNNLVGVESIAVDPSDAQKVYLSCGTYTQSANGAIFYSNDGGRTFTRVDMPFKMGGNENGRGNGERMMVDPCNSNIIYLGTRNDGLWRSTDKAESWQKVTSFPDVAENMLEISDFNNSLKEGEVSKKTEGQPRPDVAFQRMMNRGCGIICVVYDPQTGVEGKGCFSIYVGVSLMGRDNLFVSKDGGNSWKPVANQPTKYRPTHMVLSSDGNLYITYGSNPGPIRMTDGAVWKYNTKSGKWQDVSPVKPNPDKNQNFGYAAVSVDKQNPNHLIVTTFNRPVFETYSEDDIFRSIDGGKSWKPIFASGAKMDYSKAPYTAYTPLHWMFDIEIDPFDSDHAMFTTGYGGWETFNLGNVDKKKPTSWSIMSTGIEETVPLEFCTPKKGARLISAIGDYGSFNHFDLDKPSPTGSHTKPYYGNTSGITCAENQPNIVLRVGTVSAHHPEGKPMAYSLDGGITWYEPTTLPNEKAQNGHIAVSCDGNAWIWTPNGSTPYYTTNRGESWAPCQGIPKNIHIFADRVNAKRFYGVDVPSSILYESLDGITFTIKELNLSSKPQLHGNRNDNRQNVSQNRGDNRGGQDRLYSTPGLENDLWIAAYDGLYHAAAGNEFVQLDKVRQIYGFGFGKAAPSSNYPTLYLAGIVNGVSGIFRSIDQAKSWIRINDDNHQYGLVLQIAGDPNVYGRVYVGAHGRGILYADPVR